MIIDNFGGWECYFKEMVMFFKAKPLHQVPFVAFPSFMYLNFSPYAV